LEAILVAVRLSVAHERVTAELERQQNDLIAASARLEKAGERRRLLLRERLRREVLEPIEGARVALERVESQAPNTGAASALTIAARELGGAETDIQAVAEGLPPLGPGSLQAALRRLSDVDSRVVVEAGPDAQTDEQGETMLRFVASELVTNALKHASAGTIRVVLCRNGGQLTLAVEDDGAGGADPAGGGLAGVALRVQRCGGRLDVRSPTAGGTTVTVAVPVRTPSSTA
jgi:signal transduction histidine kinase